MARSLVIVESPAKAKTINRYLGSDYVVKSSVGHVRDLPTRSKPVDPKARAEEAKKTKALDPEKRAAYKAKRSRDQLVRKMGINPDKDWQAFYEILPGKEKVIDELKKFAEKADKIYLATDLDREGEAIAWHLKEIIGGDSDKFRRVVFNEITKKAIEEAFLEPGDIDMDMVQAQQARRFLDRVVGFELSPLLWAKVARGLSAGRVQSVAVRLVVAREREIRAFVPEEYWEAFADLKEEDGENSVKFQVARHGGNSFRPVNADQAAKAEDDLRSGVFKISKREDKPTRSKPNAPFITSTLQQGASTRMGFSVKKTMTMAQRLYEAGYITYMRTDSTNLSVEAVTSCRELIQSEYGSSYMLPEPRSYSSKEDAQEAHEAIRPSDVSKAPEQLMGVDADAVRLYELIRNQFIACQMPDAQYLSTSVSAESGDYELRVRGRVMQFDGFTRVLPPLSRKKDEDTVLPDFQVGQSLNLLDVQTVQHFTKPVARFGEASLVKELEKLGIGRPSTYSSIISTVQDRGYVRLESKRFYAEKIGEVVTDRLCENFGDLLDYGFTATMEEELDKVAKGERVWNQVLDNFYQDFSGNLDKAKDPDKGMRLNEPADISYDCPSCSRQMQVRNGSTGVFLGCSGYALKPKERCKQTINLIRGEEVVDVDDDEGESKLLMERRKCPKCGSIMLSHLIDENKKLHVCSNNPDCDGHEIETGHFKIKGYDGPTLECDKCGAPMELKSGRFGKYFGCTECKNTRKLLRSGEAAPPKADPVPMPELRCEKVDDYYLLRDGASGVFLAASQFPKHRETRAPMLREIKLHANELDPKFKYLLDGPESDPDGNPSILRFSRKNKEQYLQTEIDGKATGWQAFFEAGRWVERVKSKGTKKKAS
ncbi:MAG: type I DNA topoisomerase [Candidatus Azotimanducaceae bacterium]